MTAFARAENRFGAFVASDRNPHVLMLDGEIGSTTALDFRRALKARPDTKVLFLNSPGGLVDTALLIAHEVHDSGISTLVPVSTGCYSACVYLFLAGANRRVDGALGVHQIYNDANDLTAAQTLLSDILEALDEFGAPKDLISRMLRTLPGDVYVFSKEEVEALGLNRGDPFNWVERTYVEPEAQSQRDSTGVMRDLGPENLTVVPQTKSSPREPLPEKFAQMTVSIGIRDALLNNGFTDQTASMALSVLAKVLPANMLPPGAWLRMLFGPTRTSGVLIPYRLTIYLPSPDGRPRHAATVALTDRGSYVLGLEPEPATVGDIQLGSRRARIEEPDAMPGGKQDRLHRTSEQ